jgi:tetratricopeptide (TPR) repeat protein
MLNDDKNLDFLDQIYYAIAELDLKEGRKDDAIENYKQSAFYSFSNNHQKAMSFLALGELYYTDREYIEAGAFYDSCVMTMPEEFPNGEEIRTQSYGLTLLAENLKVIKVEDSLLQMAAMPEAELNKLISEKIEEAQKIEEERKRMEEEERFNQRSRSYQRYGQGGTLSRAPGSMSMGGGMLGSEYGTSSMGVSLAGSGSGQWYFYNPTTISFGQSEFVKRFGRRKLEDNWRRSNKNIASANSDISTEGEEGDIESVKSESKSKSFQPTTREYYTADIPFSDSAKTAANSRIETALFNVGKIFADELDKPEEAVDYFLQLNERYPETERLLFSYYNLYLIYNGLPDAEKAEVYKNYILQQFPDSKSATIIRNPNYFQEVEAARQEVKDFYVKTYEDYINGRYEEVINNSLYADSGFLLNPMRDKFGLLKVMAKAKLDPDNEEMLKDELNTLVFKFPESDVAEPARNLLNYLENGPSDSIKQAGKPKLQIGAITETEGNVEDANYVYSENSVHYYVVIVSSASTDVNRLKYNISSFNVENYDQDFFEVQSEVLTQNLIMISVKNFPDAKSGMDYYKGLLADPNVYADFNETDFRHFIISKGNYNIFFKNKNVFNYIRFFNDNYLSGDN